MILKLSMLKKTKHYIKRILQKFYIWYKVNVDRPELKQQDLDSTQRKAISICLMMINDNNSDLRLSSKGKRYILLGKNYVVIDGDKISIINHIYSYDIFIKGKALYNITSKFDSRIDNDREKLENEIFDNVKNSLDAILDNMRKNRI